MKKQAQYMRRIALAALLCHSSAEAGVAVVVKADSPAEPLTANQVSKLFLGKTSDFPNGVKAIPIDQDKGEEPRDEFYGKIVKRTEAQLSAYWSRLVFTGEGQPPQAVLDDDEVKELVSANPNIVGYISTDSVDESVKVIFKVE